MCSNELVIKADNESIMNGFLKLHFNQLPTISAIFKYFSPIIKVRNVSECSDLKKPTLKIYILSTKYKDLKSPNTFSSQTHSVRKNRGSLTMEDYTCANGYSRVCCYASVHVIVNTPSKKLISYKMNLSVIFNFITF